MSDSPDAALYERVRTFASECVREDPARLTLETRLFHDPGVELILAFAEEFGVDISEFDWRRHFGPEGLGCLLFAVRGRVRTDGPWPEPITLRDLAEAAQAKRWVKPYTSRVTSPGAGRTRQRQRGGQ